MTTVESITRRDASPRSGAAMATTFFGSIDASGFEPYPFPADDNL